MASSFRPEDIWMGGGVDGVPFVVSQYEDTNITIPLTLEFDSDSALANRLQEVTSIFASALESLGRVEAKITYQHHVMDKEFDEAMTVSLGQNPDIYKNSGRSVEVMRSLVRSQMDEDWKERDDSLYRTIATKDRLKRKVEALGAYKETLSRHISVRSMEMQKGSNKY